MCHSAARERTKLSVLWVLFQNGSWWWILIGIVGLNTILSAFYYFRVIRAMYLTEGQGEEFFGNPLGNAIATLCAAVLVGMLLWFGPISRVTANFSQMSGITDSLTPAPHRELRDDGHVSPRHRREDRPSTR